MLFVCFVSVLAQAEDWDFTPDDYSRLYALGGQLELAPDSAWFPKKLFQNLKATLEHVLSSETQPSMTEGVNLTDFQHGHVACADPNPHPDEEKFVDHDNWGRRVLQKAMGTQFDDWIFKMTVDKIPQLASALTEIEKQTGELFQKILDPNYCKEPVIYYHSFEDIYESRGIVTGDPRRNFRTPLKSSIVEGFIPPIPGISSSWTDLATQVAAFVFLVDERGLVHVSWRSNYSLMKFTGSLIR